MSTSLWTGCWEVTGNWGVTADLALQMGQAVPLRGQLPMGLVGPWVQEPFGCREQDDYMGCWQTSSGKAR